MPKVTIIQRRMVHYRLPLFVGMESALLEKGIKLKVVYGKCSENEVTKLDGAELPFGENRKNFYFSIFGLNLCLFIPRIRDLFGSDLVVLPQENSFIINYVILFLRPVLCIKNIAFWGHGANFQSVNKDSYSERLKRFLIRKVDWWFCYTSVSQKKVIEAGFDVFKITDLQNAIDITALKSNLSEVNEETRRLFLETTDLDGGEIGLFIGSMYPEKLIPFLLEAILIIKKSRPQFEVILVGSGPDSQLVEEFCQSYSWSVYLGTTVGEKKALALSVSRLMLNPGLVGLGILDSFASGKPMITTSCMLHSPEIAYMTNGVNGLITKYDKVAFCKEVINLLGNEGRYDELSSACIKSSEVYTVSNMTRNFVVGICQALNLAGDK